MNKIEIDIQVATKQKDIPSKKQLKTWSKAALQQDQAQIGIRIVDEKESASLNENYRHKKGPTNVLSFPLNSPYSEGLVGDIVICAPVVSQEADTLKKTLQEHWAHLVVHGMLHLQGYDHTVETDAKVMEEEEARILATLGFSHPYEIDDSVE